MHRLLLLPLFVAGCATQPPIAMMHSRESVNIYQAIGRNPTWVIGIADDSIAMRILTPGAAGQAAGYRDYRFPRTLPRTVGEVRTWQSTADGQTILIEARHAPCRYSARFAFEDSIRITLNGQVLEGCGGRGLREEGRS